MRAVMRCTGVSIPCSCFSSAAWCHMAARAQAEVCTLFRAVHALWVAAGQYPELSVEDVKDELFDICRPADPQRITRADLMARALGMPGHRRLACLPDSLPRNAGAAAWRLPLSRAACPCLLPITCLCWTMSSVLHVHRSAKHKERVTSSVAATRLVHAAKLSAANAEDA